MVMGRPNKGVDHVDNCDGSQRSKERTKVILQTITGELSVQDACERLGIQRARFKVLRARMLQGSVDANEPRPVGRPRLRDVEGDEALAAAQARITQLERKLDVAEARVLLAQMQRGKKGATAPKSRHSRERALE